MYCIRHIILYCMIQYTILYCNDVIRTYTYYLAMPLYGRTLQILTSFIFGNFSYITNTVHVGALVEAH